MYNKNILFIGPYRQTDGWGEAARDILHSLTLTRHTVGARPIYMNTSNNFYNGDDKFILDAESTGLKIKPDIVIQKVLPEMYTVFGDAKNIAIAVTESSNLQHTPWINHMNIMDEIWCWSDFERKSLIASGVKPNIVVVRMPTNLDKYKTLSDENIIPEDIQNDFIFYFIGELISRKGIEKLMLAFHREFKVYEPVQLLIKTNKEGFNEHQVAKMTDEMISKLKSTWKLYPNVNDYKKEILITGRMSETNLMQLHRQCDCFVMASSAEAWCRPAFDAVAIGNKVIHNVNTGTSEFVNQYGVMSHRVPAIAADRPLPYLYNGMDEWYDIDIIHLQEQMRKAYEDVPDAIGDWNIVDMCSLDSISKRMEEVL